MYTQRKILTTRIWTDFQVKIQKDKEWNYFIEAINADYVIKEKYDKKGTVW